MSKMLSRLLLVVLILVGQVPVGVCTCAAASDPGHRHTTELPSAFAASCCEHSHHTPDADEPAEPVSPPLADDPAPDEQHHPSCPAASPRPALMAAPTAPVETGPTAAASDAAITPPLILLVSTAPQAVPLRPGGSPVPLFISLLVLRI